MFKRIILISAILTALLTGCGVDKNGYPLGSEGQVQSKPMKVDVVSGAITANITGNVTIPGTITVGNTVNVTVANSPLYVTVNGTASVNATGSTVKLLQDVIADPLNSSTTNLNVGANFTGASVSTLGVNAIQVSLKTSQNMIVQVQQSPDGTNWDIKDSFNYYAISNDGGNGWTTQAINSYYRVVVTNNGTATTTFFRLQSVLCPIVEALPRALTPDGRLKTETHITDDYGFDAEVTPFNELRVSGSVKLAGTVFVGNVLDTNFISVNTTGTGTVIQNSGQMLVSTGTGANGYAEAFTVRRGRFIAGNANMAKLVIQIPDAGTANNKRRWGIGDLPGSGNFTITDGAYFQINGTTFSVNTLRGGVETSVTSGSFNGVYGSAYILDNKQHVYEIYYSPYSVYFTLDGKMLHSVIADSSPWTNTVTLYTGMDNANYGGASANLTIQCRAFSIHRFGEITSAPIYKHTSTANTTILKYGAGTLHKIILNNPTNNIITVYDNTAGSGTVIAIINPGSSATPVVLDYELDFYTGLTVVTAGSPDITIVYE